MREIKINEFIKELTDNIPPENEFMELYKSTPIFAEKGKEFRINFERGMLLYALITKYQPKTILEIGTAEGYATLCMAWAMTNNNIDGQIFTIDPVSHTEPRKRIIDLKNTGTSKMEMLSRSELWEKVAPKKWLEKIEVLEGFSGDVIRNKQFPKIDLVFIDGNHNYDAVKSDFYYCIELVSDRFGILFDDYIPNEKINVKKLIDDEISKKLKTVLIDTNTNRQIRDMQIESDFQIKMCWIHDEDLKKPISSMFPKQERRKFLEKYAQYEKRIRLRKKINKKIPFLENIKFRWWKK